jgi:ribosomal protein S18 acetylase RimI-like enzyme
MAPPDLPAVASLVVSIENFNKAEVDCALELIHLYLNDANQTDYRVVVAEGDASVVCAYACWGPVPLTKGTYDLYWIATHPAVRGRGFGQALMRYVEQKVLQEKGRLLVVETSGKASYTGTVRFYLELGYREASCLKDFYDVGDHKLTFVKRLP